MPQDDRQLSPEYLDDLQARPIEEVRAMRDECVAVETGLSYLRRLVQGPLDIVARERALRAAGEASGVSDLVGELPDILSDGARPGGTGRLSQALEPSEVDPELMAELDALVGGGHIADVTTMADDALDSLTDRLGAFEHKVSARRRAYHERIDALQAELTRRYQSGEATVESLLNPSA